ncbi:MAG: fibronectin type III domain-containing protein [Streptomyces sp.]|nr:fibronectin type III domain-containing protein [Streptomyces sp.]
MQATASDSTPPPIRDFTGFEIERREADTTTWTVALHQGYDPRLDPAKATVCDALPSDGRRYEYRARTYDASGNYSPYSETRAMTTPVG